MKLIITGGHLAPALSIIEELEEDTNVLLIGRKHVFEGDKSISFEYRVAQNRKIPFFSISTGRLQRTFTRHTLPSLLKIPLGFFQALRIVKSFKPDIVLALGGYVSFPVVFAATMLKVPVILHEQTLGAGLANRIASIVALKVCISWETSKKYFPASKTIFTGMPIRKFKVKSEKLKVQKGGKPLIYITGGSSGSHTINVFVQECLQKLLENFRIIHQTGDSQDLKDFDRLQTFREKLNTHLQKRYILTKFVNPFDVGTIMKTCDLVISRAGINTITELLFFNKPALLIPLNDEQMGNAIFFKELGFAEILSQKQLTGRTLYNLIQSMIERRQRYQQNKETSMLIHADASARILNVIYNELAREKKTASARL